MMNSMEARVDELQKEMSNSRSFGDEWHHKLQEEVNYPKRESQTSMYLKIHHREPQPFSIL